MLNGLLCAFKGHELEFSRYLNPTESKCPPSMARNWDGTLSYSEGITIGFLHLGLVSDCPRCGKTVDSDDMTLPILEPRFDT